MRNTGLEEAQAGIKISRRDINNHRYADDATPVAEKEEEAGKAKAERCQLEAMSTVDCHLRLEQVATYK